MRVKVGEREYVFEFEHSDVASVKPTRIRELTWCHIREFTSSQRSPTFVSSASVIRYHRDAPDREKARKAALAKALQVLDCDVPVADLAAAKERRRLFWEAYLNRKKQQPKAANEENEREQLLVERDQLRESNSMMALALHKIAELPDNLEPEERLGDWSVKIARQAITDGAPHLPQAVKKETA